jgi:hypothetical protein
VTGMFELFANAKSNAKIGCPLCGGNGTYKVEENGHLNICHICCTHNKGWWRLDGEHYGWREGRWACVAGCGTTVTNKPEG